MQSIGSTRMQDLRSKAVSRLSHQTRSKDLVFCFVKTDTKKILPFTLIIYNKVLKKQQTKRRVDKNTISQSQKAALSDSFYLFILRLEAGVVCLNPFVDSFHIICERHCCSHSCNCCDILYHSENLLQNNRITCKTFDFFLK